jgi:hypothetical protein
MDTLEKKCLEKKHPQKILEHHIIDNLSEYRPHRPFPGNTDQLPCIIRLVFKTSFLARGIWHQHGCHIHRSYSMALEIFLAPVGKTQRHFGLQRGIKSSL